MIEWKLAAYLIRTELSTSAFVILDIGESYIKDLTYRPDIDGLRAIAILMVIANHAFPRVLPGGFIGVDIFFVISGYLITGILLRGLERDNFLLTEFYVRRARRILPALTVMLATTTAISVFWLGPGDLSAYAKSLISTSLFVSNFYFYLQTGYFAPDAQLLPLLHTWSLAVEEQYYLLFPIAMVAAWRFGHIKLFICVAFVASFCLSEYSVLKRPEAAFFWSPMRAWELLTGALISAKVLPSIRSSRASLIASWAGASLIFAGSIMLGESSTFPGVSALYPCAGAALIIYSDSQSTKVSAGGILSLSLLRNIGLISYSLYLWHWPLLALLRYRFEESVQISGLALAATFGCSLLSFRFVERPFHSSISSGRQPYQGSRRKILISSVIAISTTVGVGLAIALAQSSWLSEMIYPREELTIEAAKKRDVVPADCQKSASQAFRSAACLIGTPSNPETFVLWGDSVADTIRGALGESLKETGRALVKHSCPPIIHTKRVDERPGWKTFYSKCTRYTEESLALIIGSRSIKTVILLADLQAMVDYPGRPLRLVPEPWSESLKPRRTDLLLDRLIYTVGLLRNSGKNVVLIGTYYGEEKLGATYMARHFMHDRGLPGKATIPSQEYDSHTRPINRRLEKLQGDGVIFVDPKELFCADNEKVCRYVKDRPLLTDETHLSRSGAAALVTLIERHLKDPANISRLR